MNLKQAEKTKILNGSHPELVRPHENGCPFKVGETIVLKTQGTEAGPIPHVWIEVTGKHRKNAKTWEAIYTVHDFRGVYVNQGLGYTRSPVRALDPEAPVLDPAVIAKYAAEGAQKTALMGAEHRVGEKRAAKERSLPASSRSERAKARHKRSLESTSAGACQTTDGPARPANSGD